MHGQGEGEVEDGVQDPVVADETSKPDEKPKTDEEMDAIVKNGIGVLIETLVITNEITKDYALNRPELNDEQKKKNR